MPKYYFDDAYRESVPLGDGTVVVLRTVRSGDKEMLQKGFAKLSAESRYMRFFNGKQTLTDQELTDLTELDGNLRFALGATIAGPDGEEGAGVARFTRLTERPEIAEAAVTVLDEVQGRGIGTLLLHRLAAAARERGVERFSCEFLARNQRVWRLLESAPPAALSVENDLVRAEVVLPAVAAGDSPTLFDRNNLLYRLLGQSASGAVEVRLGKLLLKWRE